MNRKQAEYQQTHEKRGYNYCMFYILAINQLSVA